MANLYISEDGEIGLFAAANSYLAVRGDEIVNRSRDYHLEIDAGARRFERIEPITALLEKGIRRLLEERDRARTAAEAERR